MVTTLTYKCCWAQLNSGSNVRRAQIQKDPYNNSRAYACREDYKLARISSNWLNNSIIIHPSSVHQKKYMQIYKVNLKNISKKAVEQNIGNKIE